jgi:NitT/TauT family transport system permease protein
MQFISLSNIRKQAASEWTAKPRVQKPLIRRFAPIYTVLMILAVWQLVAMLELVPAFLVPAPLEVVKQFLEVSADGRLWYHAGVTLSEVLMGLTAGVVVGVILGYLIARIPLLEEILSPLIVGLQSTPVVAYAPLLVIWFGSGTTCALIVFFPMLMNTVVGIRGVPRSLRDLMRVSQATNWQTFIKLEIPAALPILLAGLKTSATLAVIGAVVGEFIYANAGLGFMISLARSQFDTPLVFVAVITLAVIARVLYGAVALLESRLLRWKRYSR